MKKYIFALCLMALTVSVWASGGSLFGYGGFREPKEGVATFRIEVMEDALYKGFFVFASEGGHGDYPDTVFKSVHMDTYLNVGATVQITGRGLLYNEIPINYMARFVDDPISRRNYLELHCWNPRGGQHVVHFAETLTTGNIVITPSK